MAAEGKITRKKWRFVLGLSLILAMGLSGTMSCSRSGEAVDPLPSWRPNAPRQAIVEFVRRVVDPTSSDFVPAPERIAVFDNDGTLWAERPL